MRYQSSASAGLTTIKSTSADQKCPSKSRVAFKVRQNSIVFVPQEFGKRHEITLTESSATVPKIKKEQPNTLNVPN